MAKVTIRRQLLIKIIFSFVMLGGLMLPAPALAQPLTPATTFAAGRCSTFFFLKSWGCYIPENIDNIKDFFGILFWGVDSLLKLVAYISVGFIIWGGIKYIISQGDQNAVAGAKTTIINACIGLIIAIVSVAFVQFVTGAIQ